MHTAMLLEMAADAGGDRIGVGPLDGGWTYGELLVGARRVAARLRRSAAANATLVGLNSDAVPLLLFGSALAGIPFAPVNYRLDDDRLHDILGRLAPTLAVVDPDMVERVQAVDGVEVVARDEFLAGLADEGEGLTDPTDIDAEDIAVLLFTSGTTG